MLVWVVNWSHHSMDLHEGSSSGFGGREGVVLGSVDLVFSCAITSVLARFKGLQIACRLCSLVISLNLYCCWPHLFCRPSDLKPNRTQEKAPLSCAVFHALSHSVVHFVPTSFWNHQIEASRLLEKFGPIAERFLHLTLGTKRIPLCAGAQKNHARKWCLFLCVSLCMRSQMRFDRYLTVSF